MTKSGMFAVAALAGLALAAGCADRKETPSAEAAPPAAVPAAPAYAVQSPDSLRALATIAVDSAAKLALARVPSGAVDKVELEREGGALIWSFDITVPGQEGISEVAVNAVTGAVGAVEHEDAAAETREARQDSAAARRPAAGATKRP